MLKLRCAGRSVYDIKVPKECFESIESRLVSNRSRGNLMSSTDWPVQRRFKCSIK